MDVYKRGIFIMNESGKVSRVIYVVPVIYVMGMYMMPVLFWMVCTMQESTDSFDAGWIMGHADCFGTD